MAKYAYMEYRHPSGTVVRDDLVMAFVPGGDGGRFVTLAVVTGINKNSIRVDYTYNKRNYSARLLDHQWAFHKKQTDVLLTAEMYVDLYNRAAKWDALSSAGVDNWEGFDAAMDPGF